jgi:hypothetical protein
MERLRKSMWLLMVVGLATFALSASAATNPVPAGTCYACSLVNSSYYECTGGLAQGGTSCTVSATSCTLNGICSSAQATPASLAVTISPDLVRQIAQAHPRVAASLWTLASQGVMATESEIHWRAGKMTTRDVDQLLAGKKVNLSGTGEVIYKVFIVQSMDQSHASVVIAPASKTQPDSGFSYFVLDLQQRETGIPVKSAAQGSYSVSNWSLF